MSSADANHQTPVLVVEDESLIRMMMVDSLEDAGFRVIEASNGEEALLELEQNPDLKALMTDIEMPGSVNGIALAKITHQQYPDVAVVVVSGRLKPGVDELPHKARFFGKPYEHAEVIATLEELIRLAKARKPSQTS